MRLVDRQVVGNAAVHQQPAVDLHPARAALVEPAAEARAGEAESVAQYVQQGLVGEGADGGRRGVEG